MDLSGQPGIITRFEVEELTGILTVTFRDSGDTVTLGTIEIEDIKMRAFFEAMSTMAAIRWPNLSPGNGHRTVYKVRTDEGTTEFT